MVDALLLRWILTLVFAATGGWFLVHLATASAHGRTSTLADRTCALAHVAMSLAMIAMSWPWGMRLPLWPQLVVFALATVWFLVLALPSRRSAEHAHGSGRLSDVHHASMMAAMVWMIATMPVLMSTGGTSDNGGHHHASASAASVQAASSEPAGTPEFIVWTSLALGAFFILSSLRWISAAVDVGRSLFDAAGGTDEPQGRSARRTTAIDAACHGAMSVGMGVMFLVML